MSHIENWQEALILYASSESVAVFQSLSREFSGSQTRQVKMETFLEGSIEMFPGTFDYIHLAQEECRAASDWVFEQLPRCCRCKTTGEYYLLLFMGMPGTMV